MPARCQPGCHRRARPPARPSAPCRSTPRPAEGQPPSPRPHVQMFLLLPFLLPSSAPSARPGRGELSALPASAAPAARGNPQLALFLQVCLQPPRGWGQLARWDGQERKEEGEETHGAVTLAG